MKVKEYELLRGNFSNTGCFGISVLFYKPLKCGIGFGITEHIDLGIKYDPSTGIFGKVFDRHDRLIGCQVWISIAFWSDLAIELREEGVAKTVLDFPIASTKKTLSNGTSF